MNNEFVEKTPKEIVEFLNNYIIGQHPAKRAVAIALRNRWRRLQLPADLQDDIMPKNIIMIGPTGVGKTEIARRMAKMVNAPFVKVEASKFTEVGYVGRDVESIIRDITEMGVSLVKNEKIHAVQVQAEINAKERVLEILIPPSPKPDEDDDTFRDDSILKNKFSKKLEDGLLDDKMIEIKTDNKSSGASVEFFPITGNEGMDINIKDMISNIMPKKTKERKVKVKDALKIFQQEEAEKLLDMEDVHQIAIQRVEQSGIVFIDEIDKVVAKSDASHGGDVSREGVQRDLLPIVEGCVVNTKYGSVKTDHILFIASGAFHISKPSDIIPELQGRFPIRVEMSSLSKDDFFKILTEPQNCLTLQYRELLKTEGVNLIFEDEAIDELAEIAFEVNSKTENIGARRLHAVLEKLLDEVSFDASDRSGEEIKVNRKFVKEQLHDIVKDQDLSRYIL